ncbi:glycoside hydrolase family 2 (plasmid) [Deinococcus taeanensis]|uniref:glycoside hydrolase family 2 protein n=1 Tax=Deinococcus taeanensis TaxID=2737050 RepID=UPI001CDC7BBF|nr:glycoside hydrolase family 2 TIM barrel-domain containing protein [Deinococcus taeanensis]UBV44175.1 glycoside hydrolase family 2 [Deinococcus taeanensis]
MHVSNHPEPLLERAHWRSLDGEWRFAFDDAAAWQHPDDVVFDRVIQVPYAPESIRSGIHDTGFHPVVWYGLSLQVEDCEQVSTCGSDGRLLLHFGAVDWQASVWADGQLVVTHEGGHTPFVADITRQAGVAAREGRPLELVVRAEDDPHDLAKPRGKQDWLPEPHSIWYLRTTGIWQTVWLERVPASYLRRLKLTGDMEGWKITLEADIAGQWTPGTLLRLQLKNGEDILADDRYYLQRPDISRVIPLPDPGIDDFRNDLLWNPDHPRLISAVVELLRPDGTVIDQVRSYTALRTVGVRGGRFMLNGRPWYLRMVLDQGYWPEGLMTATDDELRRDVELSRQLGFDGARKHQKIESPRYLYWCDVLGLMVWEEMPSPYRFTPQAVRRLSREWEEVLERDYTHPCIVAWVPLNESWGVPNLPTNPAHRDYVQGLYYMTRTIDPSRPIIGNDGWEHVATDIVTIHDYAADPKVLEHRYGTLARTTTTLQGLDPADRAVLLPGFKAAEHPVMLSEFGGIAFLPEGTPGGAAWGYSQVDSREDFTEMHLYLMAAVHACKGLSGFCYTQLTDTFQERNGLLNADRSPKADVPTLARSNQGLRNPRDTGVDPLDNPAGSEESWSDRLLEGLLGDD